MRKAVRTLQDFEYRSDFTSGAESEPLTPDTISMTAEELAEIYSRARTEGEQAAEQRYTAQLNTRIDAVSGQLETALSQLLMLAEHLDRLHMPPPLQASARDLITSACRHIIDGQGDLFPDQ